MKMSGRKKIFCLTMNCMFYNLDITKIWVDMQRTHAKWKFILGQLECVGMMMSFSTKDEYKIADEKYISLKSDK
jgi:hypothetical protein